MTLEDIKGKPCNKYTEEEWNFIEEQYTNGASLQGMAKELGIPKSTFTMARLRHLRKPKKPKKPEDRISRHKWTFTLGLNKENRLWADWIKDYDEYETLLRKAISRLLKGKRNIVVMDTHREKTKLEIMLLKECDCSNELELIPNIIVDTANELGIEVKLN